MDDNNRTATLNRLTGRIAKGIMSVGRHFERAEQVGKEIAVNSKELVRELVRPSNKVLDGLAKVYEAYAIWVSVLVDELENVRDLIPHVTEVVKNSRDEQGRYTMEEMKEAFQQVDFTSFRTQRHLHAVPGSPEDMENLKVVLATAIKNSDAHRATYPEDDQEPDPAN